MAFATVAGGMPLTAPLDVHFAEGESIHTEDGYKFADESLGTLFRNFGLKNLKGRA
jgi:uncharacterized SAM-dependent methyltransferase